MALPIGELAGAGVNRSRSRTAGTLPVPLMLKQQVVHGPEAILLSWHIPLAGSRRSNCDTRPAESESGTSGLDRYG